MQHEKTLEVALSSPDRIEANAGEVVDFPIAIDATDALPARSIVAITALPEGASFSQGRPYGVTGWTLRPDEIGDLQLNLPARSGSTDMRLELVAGDGTVLGQSETRLSILPSPAPSAPVAAITINPFEEAATAETTGSIVSAPPAPEQKPAASAGNTPEVKVNTVKVVTIPAPEPAPAAQPAPPPKPARPHDGGYGLGPVQDEPQASGTEWLVTKAPVDMHAKAEQTSETVKVADKGLKVRVVARDKNWVQVTDPKTSTTGWIYNRFLTPPEQVEQ
ncbi:MAG: SH3 domain-containing protein [Actinomycetota bacterium]